MFCLITVYLVMTSLCRSHDNISHTLVTGQVLFTYQVLLYAVHVEFKFTINTSLHRGRCGEKWQEHVRAGNYSVRRREKVGRCYSAQKLFIM